jgi:hypothetical protein
VQTGKPSTFIISARVAPPVTPIIRSFSCNLKEKADSFKLASSGVQHENIIIDDVFVNEHE